MLRVALRATACGRSGRLLRVQAGPCAVDYAGLPPVEALARWRAASADNRRRFRERGDGVVDTSIGDYPCRWQAVHAAAELATHADDIGVPITHDEHAVADSVAGPLLPVRTCGSETPPEDPACRRAYGRHRWTGHRRARRRRADRGRDGPAGPDIRVQRRTPRPPVDDAMTRRGRSSKGRARAPDRR